MAVEKDNELSVPEQQREQLRQLLLDKIKLPEKLAAAPAQRRLWLVNQLEQPNASYNIPCHITLRGSLDISLLEKSVNQLIVRHSTLRTSFINNDGEPLQKILPELTLSLPFVDLTKYKKTDRQQYIAENLIEESAYIFDLSTDPLIRVKLIQSGRARETTSGLDEYVLLIVMHHIISDGWSMGVLARDLFAIYDSLKNNNVTLTPLTNQYADYTQQQLQWLKSDEYQLQLSYWKKYLSAFPTLELPTDYARPKIKGFNGANVLGRIDAALVIRLKALCDDQSVTLNMLMSTAFSLLLHKYSGQEDIVFGSPTANRNNMDVENLIGFFVNMLVIRNLVEPSDSFLSLLQQSRENLFSAYNNQNVPFENLVDELQPERDSSRNPMFQVVFAMQNETMPAIEIDGLSVTRPVIPGYDVSEYGVKANVTRFDLELHCWDDEDDIRCSWIYDTALFTQAKINTMHQHFVHLLDVIVNQPDSLISSLSILDEKEQQTFISQFANTKTDYPSDKTVCELFEDQVEATPDAPALVFKNQTLSYDELNQRANQLAHYLQACGVKAEVMVGLSVERSIEMVIAILAILKAGGAYVPLDPEYPATRIAFMLEDTAAPVLITQSSIKAQLPDFKGEIVCLDKDWSRISKEEKTNPDIELNARNLIYVMYTSGSTGQPKGVCIEHRSVVRLVKEINYISMGAAETFLFSASVSFDASTMEIWGSLLNGARLVIYPEQHISTEELARLIQQQKVTTLFLTSALFNQMVDQQCQALSGIKQLLTGGEMLSAQHAKAMLQQLKDGCLIHVYGPTEGTTYSTYHVIQSDEKVTNYTPIGKPISNTTAYILDDNRNPVPPGITGELYIGGDGLARGYLNQAELTNEKFISKAFDENENIRLYRTGDLVRYTNEGDIIFIGRIDHQIKLRGYRIELGEIETLLSSFEAVSESLVMLREDVIGDKRLVAYLIVKNQTNVDISAVREYCRNNLPAYMVPTTFIVLDEFPLTQNGKVDRKALPILGDVRENLGAEYVAPETKMEQTLAEIWSDVLNIERLGIHDNFFDLGGHSLKGTQVVSRVREQMNVELMLSEMFGYPTVAELAPIVEALKDNSYASVEVIPVAPRNGFLPLSFAQERLWFLEQLEPGKASYNMPFAFSLAGGLNVKALQSALNSLVQRHEVFRTAIRSHDGKPYLIIEEHLDFHLAVEDLHNLSKVEREEFTQRFSHQEIVNGFNLEQAPLIRARLLCCVKNEYTLFITLHHIVFDGWSMKIFLKELSALYHQYISGETASLEPLKLQFADYASWLRLWLQGDNLSKQLDFWKQSLTDLEILNLPTDHARPPVPSYRGKTEELVIEGALLESVRALTKEHDSTLYMTMLTTFNILLHRYSGQNDITVGSPIAGRNRQEIEDVIGFFVNTLVIRTKVSPELSFIELLKRVRQSSLDAHSHQDIPFEKLVEELHPDRDMSRNPLFQVMFNFVDISDYHFSLPNILITEFNNPVETTKFDLTFYVFEGRDSVQLRIDYSLDLYNETTIREMLSHFTNLLQSIIETPRSDISSLPLLTKTQLNKLAQEKNRIQPDTIFEPVTEDRLSRTIPEVFDEIAEKYAAKPAVITLDYQWTYAELSKIANAIATLLAQSVDSAGQQIAILFSHDAPMLAVIMGVLKAGKTYVPLDPNNPQARLSSILEDSQAKTLLIEDSYLSFAEQLVEKYNVQNSSNKIEIITFDSYQKHLSSPTLTAEIKRTPETNTYLLYTSGSTGVPKGVIQNDRNVLHHSRVYSNSLHLSAKDNLGLFSTYAFDSGVMDIYAALLNGATLYPYDMRSTEMTNISVWLNNNNINILHLTPTLYRHFFSQYNLETIAETVRVVVLGGEAVYVDDFNLYKKYFNDNCLFVNGLGPTESTMVLQYWMNKQSNINRQTVPVGFSVEDTEVVLLDDNANVTDVFGEIAVKSKYVAVGYWCQPALNEEKFLCDDEFLDVRLYRTGDMGRRRLDGCIEFTGRKDQQIKIRGYRIETGEIESALCLHEQVNKAAVTVFDNKGEDQLIAYIVPDKEVATNTNGMRVFLKDNLPEYMLPAQIIEIDKLPMTSTGKLARHLLPEPDFSYQPAQTIVEAETETERALQSIWQSVLQHDCMSITSNFFDLGGHSLKATQVVSRIRNELELSLPLRIIFSYPTISEMGAYIDTELINGKGIIQASDNITAVSTDLDEINMEEMTDEQVELLLGSLTDSTEQK